MYAMSHGDDSSNDEIALAGKQAARVLQSYFDYGGDDHKPTSSISMETRSRRRCSVEMASVLSESRTISSRATSQRRPVRGMGDFRGEMQAKDIFIDINENFLRPEVLPEFSTQRRSLRPRFPPYQARANART